MQISRKGFERILDVHDKDNSSKNYKWTTDYKLELPIHGLGQPVPITIPQAFKSDCAQFCNQPALSVKRKGRWQTLTYAEYYSVTLDFAQALIKHGISKALNIIGFNAPEWNISFMGSIHANVLPVGIYTTNSSEACFYVSDHSECEVLVADTNEQLRKYAEIVDRLPQLKIIIIYNDDYQKLDKGLQTKLTNKVQLYTFNEFVSIGKQSKLLTEVEQRVSNQQPGQCCTLIYTSGTTGNPKGVMLSHDNYMYTVAQHKNKYSAKEYRIVSYLPLSHVAAQLIDVVGLVRWGGHLYFATPDALQGGLINTLREVRPTFVFSVPRVWEKIYDVMQALAKSNGPIKTKIANWAKSIGKDGTFAQLHGKPTPTCFGLAEKLVYLQVKKALGLDKAEYLLFGAAPLNPIIRDYFLSLNIFLINGYGMSECAGVQTLSMADSFDKFDEDFLRSTGQAMEGTEMIIQNPNENGEGEICYKGRHIFLGYFKDEAATKAAFNKDGFLQSGDVGKILKNGNLIITGRIKELIITAGGENVAPVLIEEEIKKNIKIISNCMVIGDRRKYLSILLTLKSDQLNQSGQLSPEVIQEFQSINSNSTTVKEAINDQIVSQYIQSLIDDTNTKLISKAQHIRKWTILEGDFTVESGELTPTLKLKRRVVEQKYKTEIERLYLDPKL